LVELVESKSTNHAQEATIENTLPHTQLTN
jgi:hypothetical protein